MLSVTITTRPPGRSMRRTARSTPGGSSTCSTVAIEQDEIVPTRAERDFFDWPFVHGESGLASGFHGARTGVDSFERPGRGPEIAKQSEMEAITAADIEDTCVGRETFAPLHRAPPLERVPNAIHESVTLGREVEGVVLARIDSRQLAGRRARIEIDEAALPTSHREEAVWTGVVLEILTHANRLAVGGAADTTRDVGQGERKLSTARHDIA